MKRNCLPALIRRFDHLDAVLEMDVVVAGSVGQEQRALKLVGYFG